MRKLNINEIVSFDKHLTIKKELKEFIKYIHKDKVIIC